MKNKKNATIKDIAELVGVHHSTVSRALNSTNRTKISPKIVKKIEKAAKKLGYFPNMVAASLKHSRSLTIGVLVPDLMNPVFPPIIRGIQDTAEAAGYTAITVNTDDEFEKEKNALRMMQGRSIDGIIIATARREDPLVEECIVNNLPFVLLNRTVSRDADVNAVIVDEVYGISSIFEHLHALGHTRIAHIAGPADTSTGYDRATAYLACVSSKNLCEPIVQAVERYTIDEGHSAFEALWQASRGITAIVAGNDLLALGCIDAIREKGLTIPEDISIVGYNDMPFLERMSPPLTTVIIPKYEMGSHATRMLLDILSGEKKEPVTLRIQPKLIVRSSTGPAR